MGFSSRPRDVSNGDLVHDARSIRAAMPRETRLRLPG